MNLQLAWRNTWRNPRRTAVIMTAVIIGVWSMIFLGALMRGSMDGMIQNGIATLTGHIQIQDKGYRSDPVIENSITDPGTVESLLKKILPAGADRTPRISVSAVANNARHSGGVTLVGIDPVPESRVSFIGKAVTQGHYLKPDEKRGIIIGKALADKFNTKLGHKLVIMSQDTGKNIASRAFRIVGIFRAEMAATEKQYVFVTLSAAQDMLKLTNGISVVSVLLADRDNVDKIASKLRTALTATDYEVLTWRELLPLLTAYLNISDNFIFMWYIVVFIAMGFGIVNTTLMAVFERMREFGLFKALGMKPGWIIKEVLSESFFILIIGIAIGNALAFLSVFALSGCGINLSAFSAGSEFFGMPHMIYPVMAGKDVVLANGVVFFLGLLVSVYPAAKAARFTAVEALTHT